MLIDARRLPHCDVLETDTVIVGAGPAGITLSRALARDKVPHILVEAGGLAFSAESQAHYAGEVDGAPYDLMRTRTRRFGGSSACWAGWSRPFSRVDLMHRPWVPNSGWPIGCEDLADYQERARNLIELGSGSYEPESWFDHASAKHAPLLDLPEGSGLETVISHLSRPTRFATAYRKALGSCDMCRLLINATVGEILTAPGGNRATGVEIRTSRSHRLRVRAGTVVLAAGGIENARLLLLSRRHTPAGLGNGHDVVGRYFMDHPRLRMGWLRLRSEALARFYDVAFYYANQRFRDGDTLPAAAIGLTPEIQTREGLLQCHMGLIATYALERTGAVDAAKRVYKAMLRDNAVPLATRDLPAALIGAPLGSVAWLSRRARLRFLIRSFRIQSVLEAAPDPENRVTLARREDPFGLPETHLRWHVGELERRTHLAALERLDQAVRARGIGWLDRGRDDFDGWDERVETTWHHMGTTRMHEDPRLGVVDRDCRVHAVGNLYVAGSSVFTTGGGNMPTINILALALRLADHLRRERVRPAATIRIEQTA